MIRFVLVPICLMAMACCNVATYGQYDQAQQPVAQCQTCDQSMGNYPGHSQCGHGHCGHGHFGHGQQPSACWTSYYRNARWPTPFRAQDVNAVTSYFDVQRENGWRLHNTVGHVLFDPATGQLTDAGKNHIVSILNDNPVDRRVIFVLQGENAKQTAQRVESTQLAVSQMLPVGDLPPIYVTDRDAPGSSGAYQTAVMRAMVSSMPKPRLPEVQLSGAGSSP